MSSFSEQFDKTPVRGGSAASFDLESFDSVVPAEYMEPIPAGEYTMKCYAARLDKAGTGTEFYGLSMEVVSGEYAKRRLVHKFYFTQNAIGYTRRDLNALGLTTLDQLKRGDCPRCLLRVQVVIRAGDHGGKWNETKAVRPSSVVIPHTNEAKTVPAAPASPVPPLAPEEPVTTSESVEPAAVNPNPSQNDNHSSPVTPVTAEELSPELVDLSLM